MPSTVLVLAGGKAPDPTVVAGILPVDFCIAADSGADHAHSLEIVPDIVIGDLDSISPDVLAWAARSGSIIERHPVNKDQTDLELAMGAALEYLERGVEQPDHSPGTIFLAAIDGTRADHVLANVMLAAHQRFAPVQVRGLLAGGEFVVVHPTSPQTLTGAVGDLVSLLAMHGDANGVTTSGLAYPLHGETLSAGASRGVSNTMAEPEATVSLSSGVVVAIQPFSHEPRVVTGQGAGPNQ